MRLRRRSLWIRVPLIVALPVVLTPAIAWFSHFSDMTVGRRMLIHVEQAAAHAAELEPGPQLEAYARDRSLWIRVLDPAGALRFDADADPPTGLAAISTRVFFGPEGGPTLEAFDRDQGPLVARALAVRAAHGEPASDCESTAQSALLVCSAATRTRDGDLVFVTESSRRAIGAVYGVRYQLMKVTAYVLLFGVVLGLWLGWRIVAPLDQLRQQVQTRTATGSTERVPFERDDEIGDVAQAFNALLTRLELRQRANEDFAADLGHELKNPVAAVRAAAEALDGDALDPERTRRIARVLDDAGARLDQMVNQFLDLARAEAGLVGQERMAVDLAVLTRALVATASLRNEAVGFDVDGIDAAPILGVAERLEALVRNLLDNAATFAREGSSGRPHVRVSLAAVGTGFELSVADNGPGIRPEDREHVFDRFFTRRHGGTGLGLALASAVAHAHGGSLRVDDAASGACLRLWLPGV